MKRSTVDSHLQPITFVCGTPHGGAVDSTVALAQCAIAAGHPTTLIVASRDPYSIDRRLNAVLVRLGRRSSRLARLGWRVYERRHRRTASDEVAGVGVVRATDVVAAARRLHPAHGLLVVNSVRRLDLVRLLDVALAAQSRLVWYLREVSALAAVPELGSKVDVLVANSIPLADEAARLAGRACDFVPSVIDVDDLVEPVQRRVLLLVNTVPSYGLDVAIEIARRRPHDHVVLQESWPLQATDLSALRERIDALPNVEFRHRAPRPSIYRDTRIMLLPHSAEVVGLNRPRVALEAQHLGIPVLAYDIPGLAAVVPSGASLVASGDIGDWVEAIERVDDHYERFAREARSLAERELLTNEMVWRRFVAVANVS